MQHIIPHVPTVFDRGIQDTSKSPTLIGMWKWGLPCSPDFLPNAKPTASTCVLMLYHSTIIYVYISSVWVLSWFLGRKPCCSCYIHLIGNSEIVGSNPTLAFKFQRNKLFLPNSLVKVLQAQFSLHVHKGGLKPHLFHFIILILRNVNRNVDKKAKSWSAESTNSLKNQVPKLTLSHGAPLIFAFLIFLTVSIERSTLSHLMEELFETRHYEPRVFPTRNSRETLHINFTVAPWQIIELVSDLRNSKSCF